MIYTFSLSTVIELNKDEYVLNIMDNYPSGSLYVTPLKAKVYLLIDILYTHYVLM